METLIPEIPTVETSLLDPTLRDVLGPDETSALKKRLATFLTDDEFAGWRAGVAGALATAPWPSAIQTVADLVDGFLDTPFAPPLKTVYAKANVVQRYLDRDAYDPAEVVVVELAGHTVETSRSPRLDVSMNGVAVGSLTLDIAVVLDLKAVVLTIRDARIWRIVPGACVATATLAFYGKELAKKEFEPITLPAFESGEGIPIMP